MHQPGNFLVLPPGDDPRCYDWSIVEGLEVLIVWPGGSKNAVAELARALMNHGAIKVSSTNVGVFLRRVVATFTCHFEVLGGRDGCLFE